MEKNPSNKRNRRNELTGNVSTTTASYLSFEKGLMNSTTLIESETSSVQHNYNEPAEVLKINLGLTVKRNLPSRPQLELVNSCISNYKHMSIRSNPTINVTVRGRKDAQEFVMPRPVKVENFDETENRSFHKETYTEQIKKDYGFNIEQINQQSHANLEDDDFLSIISEIGSSTISHSDLGTKSNNKKLKKLSFDEIEEHSMRDNMKNLSHKNKCILTDSINNKQGNNEENDCRSYVDNSAESVNIPLNLEPKQISTCDTQDKDNLIQNEDVKKENESTSIVDIPAEPVNNELSLEQNPPSTSKENGIISRQSICDDSIIIISDEENSNENLISNDRAKTMSSETTENIMVSYNITPSLKEKLLNSNLYIDTLSSTERNSYNVNKLSVMNARTSPEKDNPSKDLVPPEKSVESNKKTTKKKQINKVLDSEEVTFVKTIEVPVQSNTDKNLSEADKQAETIETIKSENESLAEDYSFQQKSFKQSPNDENNVYLMGHSSRYFSETERRELKKYNKQRESMIANDIVGFINSSETMTTDEIIDFVMGVQDEENDKELKLQNSNNSDFNEAKRKVNEDQINQVSEYDNDTVKTESECDDLEECECFRKEDSTKPDENLSDSSSNMEMSLPLKIKDNIINQRGDNINSKNVKLPEYHILSESSLNHSDISSHNKGTSSKQSDKERSSDTVEIALNYRDHEAKFERSGKKNATLQEFKTSKI